MVRKENFRF